jgi:hypothetical protein
MITGRVGGGAVVVEKKRVIEIVIFSSADISFIYPQTEGVTSCKVYVMPCDVLINPFCGSSYAMKIVDAAVAQ